MVTVISQCKLPNENNHNIVTYVNVSVLGNIHLLTDFLKKHSGGNLQEKERILKNW